MCFTIYFSVFWYKSAKGEIQSYWIFDLYKKKLIGLTQSIWHNIIPKEKQLKYLINNNPEGNKYTYEL
jgi:hypothetical protein